MCTRTDGALLMELNSRKGHVEDGNERTKTGEAGMLDESRSYLGPERVLGILLCNVCFLL